MVATAEASTIRGIAAMATTEDGHMRVATRADESAYILRSDHMVGLEASTAEPEGRAGAEASTAAGTVVDFFMKGEQGR
jgi:hypothetical protein